MIIDGQSLRLADVPKVAFGFEKVALANAAIEAIEQARQVVDDYLAGSKTAYGINTGFGKFSEIKIPQDRILELQRNLILSHACGVGRPIENECVRAILLLKANTLAKGFSGVRKVLIERLLFFLEKDICPVIPSQGSVGASGDLAPLAHLSLPIIGEGEVHFQKKTISSAKVHEKLDIAPLTLEAKEGLALLNGTQFMTGIGSLNVHFAQILTDTADVVGAISAEALLCTPTAFDNRIQQARGYAGQIESANRLFSLLNQSEIRESHRSCGRVQDPYSVRCMPQVHGAVRDNLAHIARILQTELNAATDNPLIFAAENEILSGGNFHGHPIATAMDLLGIIISQLANISERRIEFMMDPSLSELPAFLTPESGIHSGFMIAQVAAASLVAENKIASHPASVDSIPTSANKEDFVTMGANAAMKAKQIVENAVRVLAIELLCACQSVELRKPLKPSPATQEVLDIVRERVPFLERDRILADDIETVAEIIKSNKINKKVKKYIIES